MQHTANNQRIDSVEIIPTYEGIICDSIDKVAEILRMYDAMDCVPEDEDLIGRNNLLVDQIIRSIEYGNGTYKAYHGHPALGTNFFGCSVEVKPVDGKFLLMISDYDPIKDAQAKLARDANLSRALSRVTAKIFLRQVDGATHATVDLNQALQGTNINSSALTEHLVSERSYLSYSERLEYNNTEYKTCVLLSQENNFSPSIRHINDNKFSLQLKPEGGRAYLYLEVSLYDNNNNRHAVSEDEQRQLHSFCEQLTKRIRASLDGSQDLA